MNMVPGPSLFENGLIVGETTNKGNPVSPNWLSDYNGRSRPVWWTNNYPIKGYECYDSFGPQHLRSTKANRTCV